MCDSEENMHLFCPDSLCLASARTLQFKASAAGMQATNHMMVERSIASLWLSDSLFNSVQIPSIYDLSKNKTFN